MLLGFQNRFVPLVEDGSKTHSIRAMRKRPFRVGDRIDAYANVRQKTMRLLGRWPCVRVERIKMQSWLRDGMWWLRIFIDGNQLDEHEANLLAWNDGFRPANPEGALRMMAAHWCKMHGRNAKLTYTFRGQIVHWKFTASRTRRAQLTAKDCQEPRLPHKQLSD